MKFATLTTSVLVLSATLVSGNAFAQSNLQMGVYLKPCTTIATKLIYNCKKTETQYYKRVQFRQLLTIDQNDGRDGSNGPGNSNGRR